MDGTSRDRDFRTNKCRQSYVNGKLEQILFNLSHKFLLIRFKFIMIDVVEEHFELESDPSTKSDSNGTDVDPNQWFFVLCQFQDWLFMTSIIICAVGSVICAITAVVFVRKQNKQSKDVFACALCAVDSSCNLSGGLYLFAQLSKWGYTKCGCQVTIYFWRLTPTLSWLLILFIAVTRYLAVVKHDYFRVHFNKKRVRWIIALLIVLSAIICLPFIFLCDKVVKEDYNKLHGATRPLIGKFAFKNDRNRVC